MNKALLLFVFIMTASLSWYASAQDDTQSDVPANADEKTKAPADSFLNIQEISTDSGLTAWLVQDESIPVISINFAFKGAGAAQDPDDKQGRARLTSNMLDEGAGELDSEAFQKELRNLSISLSYSASRDNLSGSLKTLKKNSARAFELVNLSLTQPKFDEEPLNRMREANKARIKSSLSDPKWIAARILNDKAFEGHPYAKNSGGTLTTLDNIAADDLKKHMQDLVAKNNLHVAVSGDISADELKAALDVMFGGLQDSVDVPAIPDLTLKNMGNTYVYKKENIPQSIIEIMQPGISRQDEGYHKAQIMNFTLGGSGFGSRLMEEAREKRGLTYGIYSYFYELDHLKGLAVPTSTDNQQAEEMLQIITEEFAKLKSYPVTAEELEAAQSYLIGSLPLSLTSTDRITRLLLSIKMDGLGTDYLDKRQAAIQSASADDVFALSQSLLNPNQFITVIVGNPEGVTPTEFIETLPNVE